MKTRTTEEQLAIMLQRAKTFMELNALQKGHWTSYEYLSEAIYAFEKSAHVDAPALRDEEGGL